MGISGSIASGDASGVTFAQHRGINVVIRQVLPEGDP